MKTFVRRRLDPEQRYGLRVTLFAIALMLVAVPFGLLLDQVVREGPFLTLDTAAANHLHDTVRDAPWAVTILKAISEIGRPPALFVATAIGVVFVWRHGRRRLAAFLVVTGLMGGLIDTVVKVVVDRDRPSLEDPVATAHGQSFPSGHSMSSTVVYGALLLVFLPAIATRRRPWAIGGYVALVLAIGFTRLALGVHYISDVLGGFALGAAWLTASTAAFSVWRTERGRRPVHPTAGLEPEAARDLRPTER